MNEITQLPSETTTVKAPYLESEAAAVFAAYDKGKEVFKERLALNLIDGRAEIIVKSTASKKPDPTPDPDPDPDPKPPKPPTPPTPPPTPGPDPDPDPDPKKDPRKDPVHQGNADTGGGDPHVDPTDPQPTDPRTENPTGNGNDNNHGHSDPSTVTPEAPPPAPTSGTQPVAIPEGGENPINYQPDPPSDRGPEDGSDPAPSGEHNDSSYTLPDDI